MFCLVNVTPRIYNEITIHMDRVNLFFKVIWQCKCCISEANHKLATTTISIIDNCLHNTTKVDNSSTS